MELQDGLVRHHSGHLDEVSLKPTESVKKKKLLKYQVICAVSRCCPSGLPVCQFSGLQTVEKFHCIDAMGQGSSVIGA